MGKIVTSHLKEKRKWFHFALWSTSVFWQIQIGAVEWYNASFTFKAAVGIISVAMKEIE